MCRHAKCIGTISAALLFSAQTLQICTTRELQTLSELASLLKGLCHGLSGTLFFFGHWTPASSVQSSAVEMDLRNLLPIIIIFIII